VLSGWIFFAEYAWEGWAVLPYSLVYNGIYIFAEGIITIMIIMLPPVKGAIDRIKKIA
ncbi:MAG: energy-coupled thiamine transporter ThiT, partial [Lachnospiraceae bacterium]|nr:energy-coupled thiamine transporter ThiT [Lachnospiraceae bacterium]